MSWLEETFLRKLRHLPEESLRVIVILKYLKPLYKIEAGHPLTRNWAWLCGNTKGIHSIRSRVCSCKWGGASSGKENESNSPGGYNCDVNGHVHPSDIQSSEEMGLGPWKNISRRLIGRTIENSRCSQPREYRIQVISGEFLWEGRPIPLLKPSPLHSGNEVDDWMGLDEWSSWFKSQVRDSNRSQYIANLNKLKTFKTKTMEEIAL
ncbi:hypothetical protein TNCV_4377061 [Trichonephila clavipes]|nr:hypothetical protein TNCV_4377061 [Trichonephila clavipes]